LVRSVAAVITAVDSNLTFSIRSLEEQVNASFAQERLIALVSGFFGVVALLLAGVGLYGLTAYGVSRRRVEIGVRLALGARSSNVVALVLRRTLIATGIGIFCGVFAAAAAARYLEGMLFGLVPLDPTTFIAASATLTTVAAVAAALPARRATTLDPIVTLRCE
jgi:ABC-type antimicrobial peptide transport system permease subunit